MPKATPGTVAGTKIIILVSGPPQWDGVIDAVVRTGSGFAERLCEVSGLHCVYMETDEERGVEIEREKRSGTVVETKTAQVYRYMGYREELCHD